MESILSESAGSQRSVRTKCKGVCRLFVFNTPLILEGHTKLCIISGLLSKQNAVVLRADGLCAFRAFLLSEHSEENIAFYLACEDYKNTKTSSKLCSKAKKIYEEFVDADAPREVIIHRPRYCVCFVHKIQ